MVQHTVVPHTFTFPIPENVNDEIAGALPNPAVSAWLSLAYRAKLERGEKRPHPWGDGCDGQVGGQDREASRGRSGRCCRAESTSRSRSTKRLGTFSQTVLGLRLVPGVGPVT